jgi:alpha-amylase
MHKKMLRLSRRARKLAEGRTVPAEVFDHLWAGQCNDAYWHGVFGGLYLPNLRHATYTHLLEAERLLDRLEEPLPLRVEQTDFDCDGSAELILESARMDLVLTPQCGGAMVELDFKPAAWNVLDILSRREEGYHHRLRTPGAHRDSSTVHDGVLVKEAQLHERLHVDWYRHASLLDHFLGDEVTVHEVARCQYAELGDFVNQPYTTTIDTTAARASLTLERQGALWRDGMPHRLRVQKVIDYRDGSDLLEIVYTVTNLERTPVSVRFGVEFNIGMLAGNAHDRSYEIQGQRPEQAHLASTGEDSHVTHLRLIDQWLGVEAGLAFDRPAMLWRFPIETVSLSESGFERLYQSSVVLPLWNMKLDARGEFVVHIRHSLAGKEEASR